jgi:hypothetical protein
MRPNRIPDRPAIAVLHAGARLEGVKASSDFPDAFQYI